jgi:hypothetical protein
MVDAAGLKPASRNAVRVRVPFLVPKLDLSDT